MDEQEGEEEIEPGKLPEYPRSMLKMEVSDGRVIVKAIEYKRIPGLKLGDTKLGCKVIFIPPKLLSGADIQVVLHNVNVVNGFRAWSLLMPLCTRVYRQEDHSCSVLLSPENTKVVGRYVDDMEDIQAGQFIDSLKQRLIEAQNPPRIPPSGKAKLPRGKAIISRIKPERQMLEGRGAKSSPYFGQANAIAGPSRPSRGVAGARGPGNRPSLPISVADSEDEDVRERARRARAAAILGSTSAPVRSAVDDSEDEYGFMDPNESFFDQLDAVEATATQQQSRGIRGTSAEYQYEENIADVDFDDHVYQPVPTRSRTTTANSDPALGKKRVYQELDDTDQDEDYGFDDDSFLAGVAEPAASLLVQSGKTSRHGSRTIGRSSQLLDGGTQDQPIEISD